MLKNRWVQLACGVLCTVALSNMQYGWTLFVNPMQAATHWERAGIQVAFTIMIFVNTWLSPVEGWIVDRYGPRPVVMFGGLMTDDLVQFRVYGLMPGAYVLSASPMMMGMAVTTMMPTASVRTGTGSSWSFMPRSIWSVAATG